LIDHLQELALIPRSARNSTFGDARSQKRDDFLHRMALAGYGLRRHIRDHFLDDANLAPEQRFRFIAPVRFWKERVVRVWDCGQVFAAGKRRTHDSLIATTSSTAMV
jgi:hypothetical protein